jgi:CheY-like chemotaxis protein
MTSIDPERRRVLLIEDNVDAAETMQMLLELYGHSVQVAHSGRQGVEVARTWAPDVVVSDLGLPGDLDGFAVARTLRASGWGGLLVALSGYGQAQDRERSRAAGFDGHLVKPVEVQVLNDLIARAGAPA